MFAVKGKGLIIHKAAKFELQTRNASSFNRISRRKPDGFNSSNNTNSLWSVFTVSKLTFSGWLRKELKTMTGGGSLNLKRLTMIATDTSAQDHNPRITERLFLHALETNQVERLMTLVDQPLLDEYRYVLSLLNGRSFCEFAEENPSALPIRYQKAYKSWVCAQNKGKTTLKVKEACLARSLLLMNEKGVNVNQICRALDLNRGNVNAYFKHGDLSKVSFDTASKIMTHLAEAPCV